MSRIKATAAALVLTLTTYSCASFNAYQQARTAEHAKDWDAAVKHYEKALEVDHDNSMFKISLQRARLEASRVHFEKGKNLRAAYDNANGNTDRLRLAQLAAQEFEMAVKLDPTNQYAAVELGKVVNILTDAQRAAAGMTIDEMKKRAKNNISKAQPPVLNPASEEPISLSFPRETPVKDIYRALGNAFGINILFDQGVKDDRISIELRDVTAQQALERVMQAANHFYKILDEKTIIVVPDNPQARRDYEDLVIRTFYLSNGDAEQVTNVVRTMIEARNVFPLKALNAITIRDTADKVLIAEKIIEANDKAKAEVVVDVELVQLDLNKIRDVGATIAGFSSSNPGKLNVAVTRDGKPATITGGTATLEELRGVTGAAVSFSIPTLTYALLKSLGNSELLANPELRISEGEKATLHIGQRIPVPVSTFSSINTGTAGGAYSPVTSYQYQDVGIKVSMEPRVHHNREVTLKLTVEVSNLGAPVTVEGQPPQPTFATRTIESTIRLKDGETNFLAGLIQQSQEESSAKTPFLGDLPFIGRLFTLNHKSETRTDLVLTMTPHIVRIPDITDDDLAPMWVGTTNNLTFRGVSPRIESQSAIDPFSPSGRDPNAGLQLATDGEPGNYIRPDANNPASAPAQPLLGSPGRTTPMPGSAPTNPFGNNPAPNAPPVPAPTPVQTPPPNPQVQAEPSGPRVAMTASASSDVPLTQEAALRLSPRLSPQPVNLNVKPGEEKMWNVIGLDLEGLVANELVFHYDPRTISVAEVLFGPAMAIDPRVPPVASVNRDTGTIRIVSSDGKPLQFRSGGDVIMLRVFGALVGETFLVLENPELKNARGEAVVAAISGGRARVE